MGNEPSNSIETSVSVIIPVYNVAAYLRECMESIVHQTHANLQILCVDDGSTDGSAEILQEYAAEDKRVIVIRQENAGLSAARNTALDHAHGEWLFFVDSDDWVELHAIEHCLAQAKQHGVDFLAYGYRTVTEKGEVRNILPPARLEHITGTYVLTPELLHAFVRKNTVWSKFIKRERVEKQGLRFPDGLWFEDMLFSQTLMAGMLGERIYLTDTALYNYRKRPASILAHSQAKADKNMDFLPILRGTLQNLSKLPTFGELREYAVWDTAAMCEEWAYPRLTPQQLTVAYAEVNKIVREFGLNKGLLHRMRLWSTLKPRSKWSKLFLRTTRYRVSLRLFGLPLLSYSWQHGKKSISILGIPVHTRTYIKQD